MGSANANVNTEMNKLIYLLAENKIPFEVAAHIFNGEASIIICSPSVENCLIDAVSHNFSYGGKDGLIEIYDRTANDPFGSIDGWLGAEGALVHFKRVLKNYEKEN